MTGEDLVPVFVTVGIRVSSCERTPGVVRVPRAEAARIVSARHGVAGEQAPRGYLDGGSTERLAGWMVPRLAPPEP